MSARNSPGGRQRQRIGLGQKQRARRKVTAQPDKTLSVPDAIINIRGHKLP
ncbi:hypothetical protein NQZ68_011399 [Dissostichus eleginoides]|nr:hypothetical protein NQZ68_011399 [Dissostichus eleginoides]